MANENKQVHFEPIYGSLAYELELLERDPFSGNTVRAPQEPLRRPEPERRTQREPEHQQSRQPRRRPAAQPQMQLSPVLMGSVALLAIMVVVMLIGYTKLNTTSHMVTDKQAQLQELRDENAALGLEYEKAFDQAAIKAAAQEAGMSKPTSEQIEYIELGGADLAEVYRPASNGPLTQFWNWLRDSAGAVVEYFR